MKGFKEIEVIINMVYEVCSYSGFVFEVCYNELYRCGVFGIIIVYVKNSKIWDWFINGLLFLFIMILVSLL